MKPFPLLNLPSLALERVIYFLDICSLKRLRVTCKLTKSIVDSPQTVKHIPILINIPKRITDLINTHKPWSNFHFTTVDEDINLLSQWGNSYGATTKVLRITDMSNPKVDWNLMTDTGPTVIFPAVSLLLHCVNLESLEMDEFDLTQMSSINWSTILKNLCNLRHLHIRRITCYTVASRERVAGIIQNMHGLITMTLPRLRVNKKQLVPSFAERIPEGEFGMDNPSIIREYQRLVLFPLSHKIRDDLKTKKKTSLRTLICPEELITMNAYIDLAELCVSASITLHHFKPALIPSHILDVPNDQLAISNCLGSLAGINEEMLGQPLPKLKTLEINRSNFLFISDGPYPTPSIPSFQNFRLYMSTWSAELSRDEANSAARLSAFLSCIQSRKRPSVKSVYISGFPEIKNLTNGYPVATLYRPRILHAFVNVTCLELESVQYVPREYLTLWTNLKRLHKIIFRNCLGFNDAAISGQPEAKVDQTKLILSLSDLNYIILQNVGKITAISYVKAFSQMKLVQLWNEPKSGYAIEDTAFSSLIKGPAWEHLESLRFHKIGFSTHQEKRMFRRRFEDFEGWFMRPGRESSSSEETRYVDTYSSEYEVNRRNNCFCV